MPNICLPCKQLKEIIVCTETIVIGTVASFNTLYHIYFISLSNGIIIHYTAFSDAVGLLKLTPVDGFILATNHSYEFIVNQTSSPAVGENITIDGITAKCFKISFVNAVEGDGTGISYFSIEGTFIIS